MKIKKQSCLFKVALMAVFLFVTFAGHNIELKDYNVQGVVSAKEVLVAKAKSSGGFKSSGFKSSGSGSKSSSSGYSSGGFKKSDSSSSSSSGYSSGSFKESSGSSGSSSSNSGYGSGSFKEGTDKGTTSPKGDTSKDTKKGGSSAYPVPIPVGGSPFGFGVGRFSVMKFVITAILIVVIALICFSIYKKIRNRK